MIPQPGGPVDSSVVPSSPLIASASQTGRVGIHKRYFYNLLAHYVSFYLPAGARVAEICPASTNFRRTLGDRAVAVSPPAAAASPPFDRIVLTGCLHIVPDIQEILEQVRAMCTPATRVVITYYSSLWKPIFALAGPLGLAQTGADQNWLAPSDIRNLLTLSGFELVAESQRVLLPVYVPLLSTLLNRWLAPLPGFRLLALANVAVARVKPAPAAGAPSVSVVVPARNERGNIEPLLRRVPAMGPDDELIFVEGHSNDGTWEEVQRVAALHPERRVRIYQQSGKGKGDAVRLGFAESQRDILMILDADLSVAPELLPKFYRAIVDGTGEFINGSRLVYPMEQRAMRFANILGNKFFAAAFSFLLGQPLKDTLCGTKVLSRAHYEAIARDRAYFGEFDPFGDFDLIFGAARQGLRIVELPVRYRERVYGDTNIQRWSHGMILLRMTLFAARRIKFI
jgi:glycosyl transferase family 2